MDAFDARSYWETRLAETYSLDGVGWAGMGRAFNTWMYRVRRHVFLRETRALLPQPGALDVLDIGSGTGFYVDRWRELGVRSVTGSDLTETAVERLRERFPAGAFLRMDVGDATPATDQRFDVVSAFDVLFHIVDDARFAQALRNVGALLRPGGWFLFSDNFLHAGTLRSRHQVSRSLDDITRDLHAAGFDVVRRVPMFVLLNTPVDARTRLARWWWTALSVAVARGELAGRLVGALLFPVELALLRVVREGPSTELMICRRRDDGARSSRSPAS
jgi:SAM-dependent methyltransferase